MKRCGQAPPSLRAAVLCVVSQMRTAGWGRGSVAHRNGAAHPSANEREPGDCLPGMEGLQVGAARRQSTWDLREHRTERTQRVGMVARRAPSDSNTRQRVAAGLGDAGLNLRAVLDSQDEAWKKYQHKYQEADSARQQRAANLPNESARIRKSHEDTASEERNAKEEAKNSTEGGFFDVSRLTAYQHLQLSFVSAIFCFLMLVYVSWN